MPAIDRSEAGRKQNRGFFRSLEVDKNEYKSILIYPAFFLHTEYKKKNQKFSSTNLNQRLSSQSVRAVHFKRTPLFFPGHFEYGTPHVLNPTLSSRMNIQECFLKYSQKMYERILYRYTAVHCTVHTVTVMTHLARSVAQESA